MRASPRAILFDIDDTLVDHSTAFHAATVALHEAAGSTVPFDAFLTSWSSAHRRHFDQYLAGEVSYEQQALARIRDTLGAQLPDRTATDLWSVYYTNYETAWTLFADVVPCLDALSGCRLGVLSNGEAAQQRKKLVRTGIADRFHVTVISGDHRCAKPEPEAFLRACSALDTPPEHVVYVGDHYDLDAEGARRAGLVGIWLDRADASSVQHRPPMIRSLLDLPAVLTMTRGLTRGASA
jgi:putative hydrolase of the HAD superfamily